MIDRDKLNNLDNTLDKVKDMLEQFKVDLVDLVHTYNDTVAGEDKTQHDPVPLKESRSYTEDYMS